MVKIFYASKSIYIIHMSTLVDHFCTIITNVRVPPNAGTEGKNLCQSSIKKYSRYTANQFTVISLHLKFEWKNSHRRPSVRILFFDFLLHTWVLTQVRSHIKEATLRRWCTKYECFLACSCREEQIFKRILYINFTICDSVVYLNKMRTNRVTLISYTIITLGIWTDRPMQTV